MKISYNRIINRIIWAIGIVGIMAVAPFFASFAHADHEFGTTGYLRFGAGLSGPTEERACYKAPNANWKYRLGNECDTWTEIGPNYTYRPHGEDGPVFYGRWWLAVFAPEGRQNELDFDTTELFIETSNIQFLGKSTKFWVGRKYYQRFQTHLNDFWWLMMLGDGFGIEEIDVSFGKILYAYTRNSASVDLNEAGTLRGEAFQNNHDLRLYGLPVGFSAKPNLSLQVTFSHSAGNDGAFTESGAVSVANAATSTYGFSFAAWHEESFDFLFNRLSIQYGRGITRNNFDGNNPDTVLTTTSDAADDLLSAYIVRVTEDLILMPDKRWAVMLNAIFQKEDGGDYDDRDRTWYSLGIRPYWFLDKNFRLLAEYGFDRTDDKSSDLKGNLHKLTLAGEVAADYGVWNRPVIRAFFTFAAWSDSFRGQVGSSGTNNPTECNTRTDCFSAGVQIEYWW